MNAIEVVGTGLIANKFLDFASAEPALIFASGVSNSLETSADAFEREITLLEEKLHTDKLFIYFSSYSVTYKKSKYVDHKLRAEKLITEKAKNYLVLRLTNIVGSAGNKNTVINFLIDKIKQKQSFNLYTHAERNFLDVDDIVKIVLELIADPAVRNRILNIGYPQNLTMRQVLDLVQQHLNAEGVYEEMPGIQEHLENNFFHLPLFDHQGKPAPVYLQQLLEKYYSK